MQENKKNEKEETKTNGGRVWSVAIWVLEIIEKKNDEIRGKYLI